ncbi:PREDICTED: dof zinc finger protein DOF5.6-like [Nelumbo nucifera]|uniref:Dof zinc finger protein n=2 Tax=Nelumbo nucifera TaxID=4432 RepID=A0A1U7ZSL2_NELNU|nr:PREDICTED: dof zinc finger protein DOF5.6-like [Nelumbo nucifera]DAD34566.1 TPA_asm: hypothetical protein HUJ06_005206 [Nelumbo nucifera]
MGLTSLQVCMDTSDWLQGATHEENGMDASSPSGDSIITCSRPLLERRLRPQHDQALKCPRCDSTHTKFCYYNNYSLSQPRYFCKTCRRYWTKGGSLRNIPVGGGCRKNKRVAVKKSDTDQSLLNKHPSSSSHDVTDLQLSFPEVQLSHLTNQLFGHPAASLGNPNFMNKYNNAVLDNPRSVDFMENSKLFDAILGNSRNHDFMGNSELGLVGGLGVGDVGHGFTPSNNLHAVSSPFGFSLEGSSGGSFMDTCQRLMLPLGGSEDPNAIEAKPNNKLLTLEWQDQGCSEVGKDSFGYINSLGSWTGVMNGYGSSATNPLV